jgi:hypothetical protein
VLLRGLAGAPDLRLRVLAGEDALDRPVNGVFTTDLLDPRRYLTGGEIVLTGLMWHRGPADSEAFVAAVVAAGAVALAAGDAALGSVPDDLVTACRRHGLPLFEVPVDVSFAAITEQVLAARPRPAGPGPAVTRLRALAAGRGSVAGPGSTAGTAAALAEVFAVAARDYGAAGWVLSAAGRLVGGAPAAPGLRARAALAAAWLGAAELPVTVLADGAAYSLYGVTGEPAHRLAGWFVALAGDHAAWDTDRRAIAAELAAAAAGHRARHEEARRPVRRAADDAVGRLLGRPAGGGPADPEITAALRRCGLPRCGPVVAVALASRPAGPDGPGAALAGEAAGPQVARVLLEEMLPAAIAGVSGGEAVALAPGGGAVLDRIRDVTRSLAAAYGPGAAAPGQAGEVGPGQAWEAAPGQRWEAPGQGWEAPGQAWEAAAGQGRKVPGQAWGAAARRVAPGALDLAFGVSVLAAPAGDGVPQAGGGAGGAGTGWTAAGAGRALGQARQARRVAALLGKGVRLVDAAGLGSVGLLLATAPAEARQAFQASVLSPLLDYDRDHGTELVRTLRVFLDCSGSWTKAADTMFVHVNSLRYRIRRVEELTGRDLGSLADQAALLLALRLAGLGSAEDQGTDPGGGGGVEAGQFPAG